MISRLPLLALTGALTLAGTARARVDDRPRVEAAHRRPSGRPPLDRTISMLRGGGALGSYRPEADGRHPLVGFSVACLGFIALVLLVIWIMGGFESVHLSLAGWIAYGLGVVLTSVLGVGLMALVFYSDRSGRDESAGELRPEADRRA
jgi:uncharacterized integral membrane protein